MASNRNRFGFIGLGNIGGPMALRMAQVAGAAVVYDVNAAAAHELGPIATIAASPAEVGQQTDAVGVCVRDDADVETVLCGPEGLLSGMAPGGLVLIHSTVGLETIRRLADIGEGSGIAVVDAGVTGGRVRAAEGTLVTMIGGSDVAFARARELAATFSSDVLHCGPVGSGIIAKICNNVVSWTSALAAYEAFGLLTASGVDDHVLERVLRGNGNLNEMMAIHLRQLRDGTALASPEHARTLAVKDLAHAAELAREVDWGDNGIEAVRDQMARIFAGAK